VLPLDSGSGTSLGLVFSARYFTTALVRHAATARPVREACLRSCFSPNPAGRLLDASTVSGQLCTHFSGVHEKRHESAYTPRGLFCTSGSIPSLARSLPVHPAPSLARLSSTSPSLTSPIFELCIRRQRGRGKSTSDGVCGSVALSTCCAPSSSTRLDLVDTSSSSVLHLHLASFFTLPESTRTDGDSRCASPHRSDQSSIGHLLPRICICGVATQLIGRGTRLTNYRD